MHRPQPPPNEFTTRLTAYLPASLAVRFARAARAKGQSVSGAVREAAQEWLNKQEASQ